MTTHGQFTVVTVQSDSLERRNDSTFLREAGYRVLEARSDEEAFRLAEREEGALLLLQEDDAERFHILADGAPALMWMNGRDGCEFVNKTYLDFLGVQDADVRGYDWAQFIHPDDRKGYVTAYLDAVVQRRLFEATFRFRRHDDQYRWMKSVGRPRFGIDGSFLGYVGSTIDVTDLQIRLTSLSGTSGSSDRKRELHQRFRTASTWLASAAACIAGLALVGWALGLTLFTSISSQFMSMKITTAVGFLCAAGSLLLLNQSGRSENTAKALGIMSIALGALDVLLGFGTLLGYALGWQGDATHPGWMAQSTAVCFLLLGAALMVVHRRGRASEQLSEYSTFLVLLIAGVALIGYLYDKDSLYAVGPYSSMALHTALSFVLLGAALLCAQPDRGLMATFSSDAPGAVMMRRMLPLTVGMLVISGWIRLVGEHNGWFDKHFGLTLVVGLNIVGFGMILWSAGRSLNKTEWTLRESEARLRLAQSGAGLGVFDWDIKTGKLTWTPELEAVWGLAPGTVRSYEDFRSRVHPDDIAALEAKRDYAVQNHRPFDLEFRIMLPSGDVRWLSSRGKGLYDDAGEPFRVLGSNMNITERKLAENAQAQLAAIVTSSVEAIVSKSLDGTVLTWNRGAERLFGYTASDMIGQSIRRVIPQEKQAEEDAILALIGAGERLERYETVRLHKNGRVIHVSLTISPIRDAEGTIIGASKIVHDITERRRAEEQVLQHQKTFVELVERAPFGIYIVDSQFRICHMNTGSQAGAFSNVRPVIGRDFVEAMGILWPEPVAAEIIRVFRRTLDTGEPYFSHDFLNPRADINRTEGYEWELHRIVLSDGQHGVICYYFDSTKLRATEQALRESEERLRLAHSSAKIGTFDWDIVSGKVVWQPDTERLWGLREGEFKGTYEHWRELVHPEDLPKAEALARKALLDPAAPYEFEHRIICPDGTQRWIFAKAITIRNASGEAVRMVGLNMDVTERKKAEAALQSSEEKYRYIYDNAGTSIFEEDWVEIRGLLDDFRARGVTNLRTYLDEHPQVIIDAIRLVKITDVNDYTLQLFRAPSKAALLGALDRIFVPETTEVFKEELIAVWQGCNMYGTRAPLRTIDGQNLSVVFTLVVPKQDTDWKRVMVTLTDVTVLHRAEAALRESESRFRSFFENAAIGAAQISPAGHFIHVNDRFCEITGYTRDELLGKMSPLDLDHPDEVEDDRKRIADFFRGGNPYLLYEKRYLHKDGHIVWVRVTVAPVRNEQGRIQTTAAIIEDITERKRAEQALQEQQQLLKSVTDNADVALFIMDERQHCVFMNPAAEQLTGYSFTETQGRPLYEVIHHTTPHGRSYSLSECPIDRAFPERNRMQGEEVFVHKDGHFYHVAFTASPLVDDTGQPVGTIVEIQNITSRKKTEAERYKFFSLAEQSAEFIGMCDMQFKLFYVNPNGLRLMGLDSLEQACRVEVKEFFFPEDQDFIYREFFPRVLREGHAEVEIRFRHFKTGQPLWMLYNVFYLLGAAGEPVGLATVSPNVTDRKQAEEALREAQAGLQRWNVELEQAVNRKTAELQQSQERLRALATELNLAEQRERKRLATDLHDHLQQMLIVGKMAIGQSMRASNGAPACETVLKKVDDILSDALTYSRTLVAELSPPVLRDHGLMASLKWLAEYMKNRHEHTVTVIMSEDGDQNLPEDLKIVLFQSVRELLINSAKHAGTGRATLRMDQHAGQLRIIVQDEGKGFDLAAAAAAAAAGIPSGGISSKFGLFSIQERMRALGGSFSVCSAPGQGTTATLMLPVGSVEVKALSAEGIATEDAGVRVPRSMKRKGRKTVQVLLVDDHEMIRQGLRSVLEGYDDVTVVGEAVNGEEALTAVERLRPHVVVMDINMPRMNGIEATEQIKGRHLDTIVIGLSVNAAEDNQKAMRQAGAACLITKDAAVEELHEAILNAVNRG